MSKNKIKDKFERRRFILKIIILFMILLIINKVFFKMNKNEYTDTTFIIGDKIESLENRVIVDSLENIYISFDDIKKIYDENIYFDEVNKKLITTYNKHVAILHLDEKKIIINDAESKINGQLQYMENKLYLPFSDMELVYDFEYNYSKNTNTVILDSISNKKLISKSLKKVNVKKKKGFFSKNIAKLDSYEEVTVLENNDKYYKIRTKDGIIGYVKAKKMDEIQTIRKDMENTKLENVNILSNYSEINDNYENLNLDNTKYNAVCPKIFSISENKEVRLKVTPTSEKYKKYITWLEENNINLWATITNDIEVSEMMLTYDERKQVINNIYTKMIENNYKILNINFEKINDINSFYRFLIELTPLLKEAGIKTVVTYNEVMNEEKILKMVDYLVKED